MAKRYPILPKVWEHPKKSKGKYSIKTLVASISKILTQYSDKDTTDKVMLKLREQVNDSLNSISMFRNIHENDR